MDIIEKYMAFVKRWEGSLSRDVNDSASSYPCPMEYKGKTGWHTNMGITYKVFENFYGKGNEIRFLEMSSEDWFRIFKRGYWDTMRADEYTSKECACFIVGMAWGSGKVQATKCLQQAIIDCGVNVKKDGLLGSKTIAAANSIDPCKLFDALANERRRFFFAICGVDIKKFSDEKVAMSKATGKNAKFLKGWLNRLNSYRTTFRPC